jgi:hypothetical protein
VHVVLVGPEREENLSLRYLAAALRQAGHTASLARFDSPEHLDSAVRQVRHEQPGLLGLSMVFQARGREFYELARALRGAGYAGHLTAGGHFATIAYEAVLSDLPELDSVVRHEGEATIVELADALQRGAGGEDIARIPGMVVRGLQDELLMAVPRRPVDDLDTLPFPARDTPPMLHLGVPTAYLVGSRGCYAACDYCCIASWHKAASGPRYRVRSPENLADEMALLYRERGVRNFVFHDDNFFLPTATANRERSEALRAELRKRKLDDIGLVVKLRPNDCDRDNLLTLQDIGLMRVFVGIENTRQRQLRSLGRSVAAGQLERSLDLLRDLDIYCAYNLLLFDAYTTLDDIAGNLRFLRGYPAFAFNWCRVEVYAGTALEKRYAQEGRLRGDYLSRGYEIEDPRARLMYELLLPAVDGRNFDCEGLATLNIGLGYYHRLLKHFHPDRCSPELSARVQSAIEAVNANAVDLLERTYHFVSGADLSDCAAIERFAAQLECDAFGAEKVLTRRVWEAIREVEARARVQREAPDRSASEPANAWWRLPHRLVPRRSLLASMGAGLLWLLSGCGHHAPTVPSPDEPPPIVPPPDPPPPAMDRPRSTARSRSAR